MKQYIFGQIRVEAICDRIIRIERKNGDSFFDENTFFVPDRNSLFKDGDFSKAVDGGVKIGNYEIRPTDKKDACRV